MTKSNAPAVQDFYPDDFAQCFCCGRLNPNSHGLKSFVEGDEVVAHFLPLPHQISVPGFVYGGLIASLVDCHAMATAAAAAEHAAGRRIGDGPTPRYVTAIASCRLSQAHATRRGIGNPGPRYGEK